MLLWACVLPACGMVETMVLAWVVQRRTRNAGWVDAIWSFGTGLWSVCGVAFAANAGSVRPWLVGVGVALWSLRLGGHVIARTRAVPHEDRRYAAFRAEWGAAFERRMFTFLLVQAVAAWPLIGAVVLAAHNPCPFPGVFDLAAVLVIAGAVAGEAAADSQIERFRRDPGNRGRVCDRGLWARSRHPNYFFEWLGWCAYPLFAVGTPWGWLALAAPAWMYWLLVRVSGIPPLEAAMLASRGEAYRAYQARVPAFFPRLGSR